MPVAASWRIHHEIVSHVARSRCWSHCCGQSQLLTTSSHTEIQREEADQRGVLSRTRQWPSVMHDCCHELKILQPHSFHHAIICDFPFWIYCWIQWHKQWNMGWLGWSSTTHAANSVLNQEAVHSRWSSRSTNLYNEVRNPELEDPTDGATTWKPLFEISVGMDPPEVRYNQIRRTISRSPSITSTPQNSPNNNIAIPRIIRYQSETLVTSTNQNHQFFSSAIQKNTTTNIN